MPLIFYIEPDIPESIHTLTLSYTLYNITSSAATQGATLDISRAQVDSGNDALNLSTSEISYE